MSAFEFNLHRSKLECLWLLAGYGLAWVAVWLSGVPLWGKWLASAGLAASAWVSWRRAGRPRLIAIRYDGERWTLVSLGKELQAQLLPSTWCSRWLTLLHFRLESGHCLAIPVWRDSLADDDYRRLRVVLRWQVSFQR